jgi:demethylmenaquinone methyltransferase/2-methoxy-6-polyprenyl-1,4-benzoquinol methylase/phosphoethanolamine N-methyltransferase
MQPSQTHEHALETRGLTIRWAALYDIVVGVLALGRERAIREMTVEMAAVQPGNKVLDVGCGTGSLTLMAKARAGADGEVHGIDAASEMINLAQRKAAQANLDVDFQSALIERIPFPDDYFDVVLSSLMLHHLPDDLKRKGFTEIKRVLKSGGCFFAVDFDPPGNPLLKHLATHLLGHGMMQSNVRDLVAMMQVAGFAAVETGKTKYSILAFVRGRKP